MHPRVLGGKDVIALKIEAMDIGWAQKGAPHRIFLFINTIVINSNRATFIHRKVAKWSYYFVMTGLWFKCSYQFTAASGQYIYGRSGGN